MSTSKHPLVTIRPCDPTQDDARRCLELLSVELRRRTGANGVLTETNLLPPAACFLLAYLGEEAVGCGAVVQGDGAAAGIQRLWVDRSVRRLGIGRLMLAELESRAIDAGAYAVNVQIDRALYEATALYRSSDYLELPVSNGRTPSYRRFEKPL